MRPPSVIPAKECVKKSQGIRVIRNFRRVDRNINGLYEEHMWVKCGESTGWTTGLGVSSHTRKRESRAGKDGSFASASSRRHRPFVPTEAGIGMRNSPSVIPAKAGIQGRQGRVLCVRLEPSSQALRPHGSRNRDTKQPPSSFPRKRESMAGKDGSFASASSRRHRPFVPMEAGDGIRNSPSVIPAKECVKKSDVSASGRWPSWGQCPGLLPPPRHSRERACEETLGVWDGS